MSSNKNDIATAVVKYEIKKILFEKAQGKKHKKFFQTLQLIANLW